MNFSSVLGNNSIVSYSQVRGYLYSNYLGKVTSAPQNENKTKINNHIKHIDTI